MYQRITKRRIFYISGLVSLVLLPLLGYWFIDHHYQPKAIYSMEIIMPGKIACDEEEPIPPIKLYLKADKRFIINGNALSDKLILDSVKQTLLEIKKLQDNFLLEVTLSDKAKYQSLITLFDFCNVLGFNRYALFDNDLRIYHFAGANKLESEYEFISPVLQESTPDNRFSQWLNMEAIKFKFFVQNVKYIWPSVILFFIKFILTFRNAKLHISKS